MSNERRTACRSQQVEYRVAVGVIAMQYLIWGQYQQVLQQKKWQGYSYRCLHIWISCNAHARENYILIDRSITLWCCRQTHNLICILPSFWWVRHPWYNPCRALHFLNLEQVTRFQACWGHEVGTGRTEWNHQDISCLVGCPYLWYNQGQNTLAQASDPRTRDAHKEKQLPRCPYCFSSESG